MAVTSFLSGLDPKDARGNTTADIIASTLMNAALVNSASYDVADNARGGAVNVKGGATFSTVTITGNCAESSGGGVYFDTGGLTFDTRRSSAL